GPLAGASVGAGLVVGAAGLVVGATGLVVGGTGLVVGIVDSGGGFFGQDRLPVRAGLGIQAPADRSRSVTLLRAHCDAAVAGRFLLRRFGPVLIDHHQQR